MKPRFLVIDDEPELSELLCLLITDEITEAEVVTAQNGNQAIEILKSSDPFDVVICDYHMNPGNGGEVYRYLKNANNTTPFLLVSGGFLSDYPEFKDFEKENKGNLYLPKPFDENILLTHLRDIISNAEIPERLESSSLSAYIKVSLDLLDSHITYCPNAYIRLGEEKLVLAIRAGAEAKDQVDHFKLKGHDTVFIKREDFRHFVKDVFEHVETNEVRKYQQIWEEGFIISQDLAKNLGVDRIVKEIVDEAIEESLQAFDKHDMVAEQFKSLMETKPFIISHSILCCYLGAMIYKHLNWSTSQILQSHIRASFLHDLFATKEDLKFEMNSLPAQKANFYDHCSQAAQVVEELWPSDQTGVSIVSNHHELPRGEGGPKRTRSDNLPAPSAVFNLCHLLACETLRLRSISKETISLILNEHPEFNEGVYAKKYKVAQTIWGN